MFAFFSFLWNPRMVEVERSLLLLKLDCQENVAQKCVQTASEYLQGWRFHNHSGEPVPLYSHPRSKKSVSSWKELPMFQFVPRAPPKRACFHLLYTLPLDVCRYR